MENVIDIEFIQGVFDEQHPEYVNDEGLKQKVREAFTNLELFAQSSRVGRVRVRLDWNDKQYRILYETISA